MEQDKCVACDRSSVDVPLITLDYRGGRFHICPKHLPILIHDPKMLAGKLPGAESMDPADHKD